MSFEEARESCLRDEAAERRARLYVSARVRMRHGWEPWQWLYSENLDHVDAACKREVNAIIAMVWGLP